MFEGGLFRCYSDDEIGTYQIGSVPYCDYILSDNNTDKQESQIIIYPNPANSVLNIDFADNYNILNTTIEIMDINGRTMLKSVPFSISTQLDIKELTSGLYLVKIQNDKSLITKRIIIQ